MIPYTVILKHIENWLKWRKCGEESGIRRFLLPTLIKNYTLLRRLTYDTVSRHSVP